MSIEHINVAGQFNTGSSAQRFQIEVDALFSGGLRLNQVIKGQVMRQYDGGKYGVSFGGEEKVVDSTIPLKTGETLYGRIIGLEGKVHLQRVFLSEATNEGMLASSRAVSDSELFLQQLSEQHNLRLTTKQQGLILQVIRSSSQPQLAMNSALMLGQLGITINQESLQTLLRFFQNKASIATESSNISLNVASDVSGAVDDGEVIDELSSRLAAYSDENLKKLHEEIAARNNTSDELQQGASGAGGDARQSKDGEPDWQFARWILNAQNSSSVNHRFVSIPMWFGDKLVEIDIAMFSQNKQYLNEGGIRYRKLVFSLVTEGLGKVDIVTLAANRHLNIEFNTESQEVSDFMSLYTSNIKNSMSGYGWIVDETSYKTSSVDENMALNSVVNHFISSDSLSRLM